MPLRRALLPAAVVFALTACAHASSTKGSSSSSSSAPLVRLLVQNRHFASVRLFIVREGVRTRIGEVPGVAEHVFLLPARLFGHTGEFRLAASPFAETAKHETELLIVRPGQKITWTIEQRLETSSVGVH